MGFGLSFGKKKQSSSSTGTIDKTTTLTGNQDSTTQSAGTTTTNTVGQTNTSQQENTSNLGTQDSRTSGTTTGRQTGTTTTLGADVQDALASKVKSVLGGGITDESISALNDMIVGRAGSFDTNSFVEGVVGQARNRGEQVLQEQNSAFGSAIGGTAGTNSMAALLAQRGSNDLAAQLAGIESQARAQAEGIQNQNLSAAAGGVSSLGGLAEAFSSALKGGTTTVDMTSLTDEIQQLIGKTGNIGTSTTTGSQTQQQSSETNQLLTEIANILTNQSQREVGTTTENTKGKSGGFGASLGF